MKFWNKQGAKEPFFDTVGVVLPLQDLWAVCSVHTQEIVLNSIVGTCCTSEL